MKKLIIILCVFSVCLCGCGNIYKNKFDCAVGPWIGCESVSTVNKLVNEDKLNDILSAKSLGKKDSKIIKNRIKILMHEYVDDSGVIHPNHYLYIEV